MASIASTNMPSICCPFATEMTILGAVRDGCILIGLPVSSVNTRSCQREQFLSFHNVHCVSRMISSQKIVLNLSIVLVTFTNRARCMGPRLFHVKALFFLWFALGLSQESALAISKRAAIEKKPCATGATDTTGRSSRTEQTLQTASAQFIECVQTVGIHAALRQFADTDGKVVAPSLGVAAFSRRAISERLTDVGRTIRWKTTANYPSKTSDMLIQVGTWALQQPNNGSGSFIAVWQLNAKRRPTISNLLLTDDRLLPLAGELDGPTASAANAIAGRTGDAVTLAEIQFGGVCGASGMSAAFDALAKDDVRVLRTGGSFVGKKRAVDDPRIKSERWRYIQQQSGIDNAHQLAYVFGRYAMTTTEGSTERGYFARIWKAEPGKDKNDSSNWRVAVDAATPLSRQ
jgi:hypothetical protein